MNGEDLIRRAVARSAHVAEVRIGRGVPERALTDSDALGPAMEEAAPIAAALNAILAPDIERLTSPVGPLGTIHACDD